jgi:uncharacterized protein DUF2252
MVSLLAARSHGLSRGAAAPAAAPLSPRDFHAQLTVAKLRAYHPEAPDALFSRRGLGSADRLMRAFVAAYWADLAQIPLARVPGGIGLCFGDAHPENFGFLKIGRRTVFGFNDLDDSGVGPVALDAARYFAVLRLRTDDPDLVDRAIERYARVVRHRDRAKVPPHHLEPDWRHIKKQVEEAVDGDRLIKDDTTGLEPVSAERARDIEQAMNACAELRGARFLDVGFLARDVGGSAGLDRYRVLVDRGGKHDVLELKRSARPGIEALGLVEPLEMEERLPILKRAFWGSEDARDDFYLAIDGVRFLVRDREAMGKLDPFDLHRHDRRKAILRQVDAMATLHGASWGAERRSEIGDWIDGTSRTLAARWRAVFAELDA